MAGSITSTEKCIRRRTVLATIFSKSKHRRIILIIGGGKDPDRIRFKLEGLPGMTNGLDLKELFHKDMDRTVIANWTKRNEQRAALGKRKLPRPWTRSGR